MNVLVILNGISGRKRFFYHSILPSLQKLAAVKVLETLHAGHAEELASNSAKEPFDIVFAAGGDGTLHQVLNGLVAVNSQSTLGLIPLGTGNDFARSVDMRADAQLLTKLIQSNQPKAVDVGLANLHQKDGGSYSRYFMNECSLGMGPEVVRRIQEEGNSVSASLTYYKSIVKTFLTLPRPELNIKTNNWEWSGKACTFAMANGKAYGHAVYIAPDAELNDGKLNTFLAGDFPVWRFLLYLQSIKHGKKVNDPKIKYGITTSIEVSSDVAVPIEADGELIGFTPLRCEVKPRQIKFLY
jgi:diacylglycerol kinase (ATP)